MDFEGFYQYPAVSGGNVNLIGTWINSGGASNSSFGTGPNGTRSFRPSGNFLGTYMFARVIDTDAIGSHAFHMHVGNVGSDTATNVVVLTNFAGTAQISFSVDALGFFVVSVGGTVIGTAEKVIQSGVWHHIAYAFEIHATDGRFSLWIDGEPQLELTGIDTWTSGTVEVSQYRLYAQNGSNFVVRGGVSYANIVWDQGEFRKIKEGRIIERLIETTVSAQWTPLSGTNNEMVDESACDSDTTYNGTTTVGHRDQFTLQNLSEVPSEIFGVKLLFAARKEDAAERQLDCIYNDGSLDLQTDTYYLTQSYQFYPVMMQLHPATGLPWTPTQVNGIQPAYRLAA